MNKNTELKSICQHYRSGEAKARYSQYINALCRYASDGVNLRRDGFASMAEAYKAYSLSLASMYHNDMKLKKTWRDMIEKIAWPPATIDKLTANIKYIVESRLKSLK